MMTELLTREEEYELGTKIQKMVKVKELAAVKDAIKGKPNSDYRKFLNKSNKELLNKSNKELVKERNALTKKILVDWGIKTQEDEARVIKEGLEAITIMVNKNLGLVHSEARGYRSHYGTFEYDDIVQYGMLGLMTAIYKYDPTRKNKFSTLAKQWIFQSINRNTNNYSRAVRLPENKISQYGRILEIQNRYENDDTISNAEIDEVIMNELKINNVTLKSIRKTMESQVSLNNVISNDDSGTKELIDFIDVADNNSEHLEDSIVKNELLNILNDILVKLDKKEQDVLSSSFAMALIDEPLKPAEVREKYKMSRTKYNSILNKSLDNIKKELESLGLTFADFI